MITFVPSGGATFSGRYKRMKREQQRSIFILCVPALALFFIMGFRSAPESFYPAKVEHPVHISLTHLPGHADAGGGKALGETPKVGVKPMVQHPRVKRAVVEMRTVATAASVAPTHAAQTVPTPAPEGASGNAAQGDSGEGGGQGGGVGTGLGFGNGAGVQGQGSGELTQLPEPFSKDWACEWPWFTKIKDATVQVRVTVDKHGRADDVQVVSSDHHEFDQAAAVCALHARYRPGVDKDGKPAKMDTKTWPIHYHLYVAGEK